MRSKVIKVLTTALIVLSLAGCGGAEDKSVESIVDKGLKPLNNAKSYDTTVELTIKDPDGKVSDYTYAGVAFEGNVEKRFTLLTHLLARSAEDEIWKVFGENEILEYSYNEDTNEWDCIELENNRENREKGLPLINSLASLGDKVSKSFSSLEFKGEDEFDCVIDGYINSAMLDNEIEDLIERLTGNDPVYLEYLGIDESDDTGYFNFGASAEDVENRDIENDQLLLTMTFDKEAEVLRGIEFTKTCDNGVTCVIKIGVYSVNQELNLKAPGVVKGMGTNLDSEKVEAGDTWEDLAFEIDGNKFNLPCTYYELEAFGWVSEHDFSLEDKVKPGGKVRIFLVHSDYQKEQEDQLGVTYKPSAQLYAEFYNDTEEKLLLKDCKIYSLSLDAKIFDGKMEQNIPDVQVAGLHFGDSKETVERLLGIPKSGADINGMTEKNESSYMYWRGDRQANLLVTMYNDEVSELWLTLYPETS